MLRRFWLYLEKVFEFTSWVGTLRDERQGAQIPTSGLWLSLFWMFVLRIKSFNALEQDLRLPKRWGKLAGGRRPSADTLGYGLCRFAVEPMRALLRHHHRTAWRNKAIQGRRGQKMRVVALDGHELYSSTARCCPGCLIRDVEVKTSKVTLDAIYLEAPFLKKVRQTGKHFVVVMKQERRELYRDADQLRALQASQVWEEAGRTSRVWDLPGLTTFETYGEPVRVVWTEDRIEKFKVIGGQRERVIEESTWVWVTNLPAEVASARWIQLWGHDRWNLENRGFNELVKLWGMDHCFVHLPRAIEVILLTLALAFLLTYLFFERNLKPEIRAALSRLVLAQRMREELAGGELAPSG